MSIENQTIPALLPTAEPCRKLSSASIPHHLHLDGPDIMGINYRPAAKSLYWNGWTVPKLEPVRLKTRQEMTIKAFSSPSWPKVPVMPAVITTYRYIIPA